MKLSAHEIIIVVSVGNVISKLCQLNYKHDKLPNYFLTTIKLNNLNFY